MPNDKFVDIFSWLIGETYLMSARHRNHPIHTWRPIKFPKIRSHSTCRDSRIPEPVVDDGGRVGEWRKDPIQLHITVGP